MMARKDGEGNETAKYAKKKREERWIATPPLAAREDVPMRITLPENVNAMVYVFASRVSGVAIRLLTFVNTLFIQTIITR